MRGLIGSSRRWVALAALSWAVAAAGVPEGGVVGPERVDEIGSAGPSVAEARLERAFAVRHDCDTAARLTVTMWGRRGERRVRELELLTMEIEDRLHALARIEAPRTLRGMAVLIVENRGAADDTWVYLPSLRRTRRISSHRRGDAFLGSDLVYADFERHRLAEYEVVGSAPGSVGGEAVLRIETRPLESSVYQRVDFWVAEADAAILRTEDYQRGEPQPVRVLRMPRQAMRAQGRFRVPEVIHVEHVKRGTRTEVTTQLLEIEPALDPKGFSVRTLSRDRLRSH